MTAQLAPQNVFRSWDNNGNPLFLGQLFTYAAGTTIPQATYTDSTQSTPNTNPVILNARGESSVWLDPTLMYKLVLQDSAGNLIWTQDQVPGGYVAIPLIATIIPPVLATITNQPILASYVRTAAEIAAGVTPANYAYAPYDLRRYGADPTGVANSDTAFNNAVAVLAQVPGGTIRAPAGLYSFANASTALNNKSGIVIQGDGGPSSGLQPGTRFQFTGTGSGVWFALNSAQGVQFKGIQFVHTQATFTGTYFQCNNTGSSPSGCGLYDCTLGTSVSNVLHLDINQCQNFSCERVVFQYSGSAGSVRGAQVGGYAFNIAFRDCEWFNGSAAPIQNAGPHQAWTFSRCDFEGLSQVTNHPAGAILSTAATGTWAGLDISGCWFGDVGTAVGTWIDIYADGFHFHGNYISGNATGTTAITLRPSAGVVIEGNDFDTFLNGINFATAPTSNVVVQGNLAGSVTNPWVNSTNVTLGTLVFGSNFGFGIPSGHGSLGTNGFTVNSDGSIDIWGLASVTTASGTFSFPAIGGVTGFPTNQFNVQCTLSGVGSTANTIYPSSLTKTGFGYTIGGAFTNPTTFYYRAKGN